MYILLATDSLLCVIGTSGVVLSLHAGLPTQNTVRHSHTPASLIEPDLLYQSEEGHRFRRCYKEIIPTAS